MPHHFLTSSCTLSLGELSLGTAPLPAATRREKSFGFCEFGVFSLVRLQIHEANMNFHSSYASGRTMAHEHSKGELPCESVQMREFPLWIASNAGERRARHSGAVVSGAYEEAKSSIAFSHLEADSGRHPSGKKAKKISRRIAQRMAPSHSSLPESLMPHAVIRIKPHVIH